MVSPSTALARVSETRLRTIDEQARDDYQRAAHAANTERAYRADWRRFSSWCDERDRQALPADPETISLYLSDFARCGYKVATIRRHLAAIATAHQVAGAGEPTRSAAVRFTMSGIRRVHGTAQEGKAPALVEDLQAMVAAMKPRRGKPWRLLELRDRALLLVGFAGAFRRSELVALDLVDVELSRAGCVLRVRRSKTDQEGQGRKVGLPRGQNTDTCPVASLRAWIEACGTPGGALFRSVNRHGGLGERLSDRAVALVVKKRAEAVGLDPERFAGHSLRSGFATSAIRAGASELQAMRQTGHRSQTVFRRYVRDAEVFDQDLARKIAL